MSAERLRAWRNPRCLLLALSALALVPAFWSPTRLVSQPLLNYLFVVDITQSMNVRDYQVDGQPVRRLSRVKAALIKAVGDLPCGARVGVGLFTGWQPALLFEPIEVCRHGSEIRKVIRHIDWRYTWVPQSNIARGLGNTLALLDQRGLKDTVPVFVTDGDEAPPVRVSPDRLPAGAGQRARGLLVGAGDVRPSQVPILSPRGRTTGYFQSAGKTYLSALKEDYLRSLAAQTRLDYRRLRDGAALSKLLVSGRYASRSERPAGASWIFAALALGLLVAAYIPWRRFAALSGRQSG